MSETTAEVRKLAREVIEGGIVAQAAERLVYQIVEVCAEHEEAAILAFRIACLSIARSEDDGAGTEADGRARRIAERIAALAPTPTRQKPAK